MKTIYFTKMKDEAKIPSKEKENGGYDVYACFDEDYIEIPPHEVVMIPSGIASIIPEEYVFVLKERGSTGTKNMGQRSGIIDSSFRGEWFVPISNLSNNWLFITKVDKEEIMKKYSTSKENAVVDKRIKNATFYPYEKAITQAILLPVPKVKVKEMSKEELDKHKTKRGSGALGSSGK